MASCAMSRFTMSRLSTSRGAARGARLRTCERSWPESPRARAGGEPPRAWPLRAARPAGTAVWLGRCEAHAPGDVVSPAAQQRHHPSFGAAPRCTGRPVPRLVRAGARVAGRGAERDGARFPGVRAHRDVQRLSSVLGGLCAPRILAYAALHGADRAVPPVHRLSGDLAPDPESLGGALHTPSRSTCIGYCLTPHRTVSKPHFLRVLGLQILDFVKPLFEKLTLDTVWHWS